ncbi:endonuclease domain-containing protein [Rhizobium sp. RU36D]|uniref:endonuclease domain-containing protein n=1 Tax=Rhizobium sp. RU36D TaxID=1907415 RepID=UPI0009D8E233|nr:endonuclease domain-containing protein [Rhizobium sp. RU36D]SMD03087.1 Very-short-patch-repair endonuclease [Rhizobium sp. RU36D]
MPHFEVPERNRGHARRMRNALPESELRFWNAVRAHRLQGLSFRRQMPIAGYIVDFACQQHQLVVEIDGESHSHDQQIERDGLRDRKLTELGWTVLRITNEDVLHRLDEVCTHILRLIGESHP